MVYSSQKTVAVSHLGVPMRKRTEKACDQCRRRKTKCDGRMTCKACVEIGLDCSYGHRIKQARGPQYVAHLEGRLKELENDDERRRSLNSWQSHAGVDRSRRSSVVSNLSSSDRNHSESPTSLSSASSRPSMPNPNVVKIEPDEQRGILHRRTRTNSEILSEAKDVLDSLSPTNYRARYASECIDALNQSLYQNNEIAAPPLQPVHDFPLFGSDSFLPNLNTSLDALNSQFLPDAYIEPNQTFALPNNQMWSPESQMNFFGAPAA